MLSRAARPSWAPAIKGHDTRITASAAITLRMGALLAVDGAAETALSQLRATAGEPVGPACASLPWPECSACRTGPARAGRLPSGWPPLNQRSGQICTTPNNDVPRRAGVTRTWRPGPPVALFAGQGGSLDLGADGPCGGRDHAAGRGDRRRCARRSGRRILRPGGRGRGAMTSGALDIVRLATVIMA